MKETDSWLVALGLEQYTALFQSNDIDLDTLALLQNDDLKEMGIVSVGHRRRLLDEISKLKAKAKPVDPTPDQETDLPGERRQVTILFADLVGFTQLSDALGAERTHSLLNRYFNHTDTIIKDFGGVVDKHIGDSVMACFGAPISFGNDSERAVLAALEIHTAMAKLSAEMNEELRVHIGVASGEVVASNTGSDAFREYTVTGNSVNLASRLQEIAGPGETIVSDAVYRSTRNVVNCDPLNEIDIRGLNKPVRIWRVTSLPADSGRPRRDLVGRRSEMRQFKGILEECSESGEGTSVHIRGNVGIGKTRLVEEFIALAQTRKFACHKALVLNFGVGKGQDAIRTLVRSLLEIKEGTPLDERIAVAELIVSRPGIEPSQRVFLNDFLDIPQPAELLSVYEAMDNDTRNRGKENIVAEIIRHASQTAHTLIVIEDVHWADKVTLAHIANISSIVSTSPAILVITSRPEGDPIDASWRAQTRGAVMTTVDIGPLRQPDALEFAKRFVGNGKFVEDCIKRADGNPLFLEQLLQNAKIGDDYKLPDTIQSLVLARMDSLPKAEKMALQAASVIGQRFDLQCLQTLLDSPDYDCERLIDELLVRPEGEHLLFSHALIQEGVYSSLLQERRTNLHRKAAEWFAGRDHIVYAQHLDRAEDGAAASALGDAARIEANEYRLDRALTLVDRGMELAKEDDVRFELSSMRGELLHDLGYPEESVEAFRAALQCAESAAQKCQCWLGIAAGLRVTDQYDEALSNLEKAEELALTDDRKAELSKLHHLRGNLYFPTGKIDECLKEHTASLEYAIASDTPANEARALSGMGDAEYARGRLITADGYYQRCLNICLEGSLRRIEAANLAQVAHIQHYFKPLKRVFASSVSAIEAAAKIGHDRAEVVAHLTAVDDLLDLEEFGKIINHLERVRVLEEKLGARRFRGRRLTYEAQVERAAGHEDKALALLQEAIDSCKESGLSYFGPVAFGEFALTTKHSDKRQSALAEGAKILEAGSMSRNHFWFYRAAIEASWIERAWEPLYQYTDALEAYTKAEPLPWCQIIIERGRALAEFGHAGPNETIFEDLSRIRKKAEHVGLRSATGVLEKLLAAR